TDIRMPQLDGLQLTREVRSRGWKTKVIMITGFKDFAYAQSALRYGVLDFITKPCVEADILALLDRAYDQLVEEQQSQWQIDIWQRQHEDSQLRSAIVGISHPAGELAELLGALTQGEVYFLSVPSYTSADKGYASEDVPLLHFAVDNMIGELGQQWLGER
ncbi:response regulator, partial [Paenibacillus sp. 598K]|uniref:response regulator n=1 Tax=Paenibacillus sp. 598K TaxID=1117987 RepID=UPI000FFE60A2